MSFVGPERRDGDVSLVAARMVLPCAAHPQPQA
jgi:hypothetical protein